MCHSCPTPALSVGTALIIGDDDAAYVTSHTIGTLTADDDGLHDDSHLADPVTCVQCGEDTNHASEICNTCAKPGFYRWAA